MDDLFSQDYDLNELHLITPAGREFQMLITPRFIGHYVNNVYEEYSSSLLLKHIKPGSLFIDIGAHYGYYTLLAGTGRPDCRVMAFEPSPVNFSILEKNVRHNKLSNVELYQMAVSDRTGMAEFHITEASDNCGFSGHPVSPSIDIVQVKTVRLDDFDLKTAGDIVVKMDIEGHEYEVIRGMDGLIRHSKDIRMLVEFNPKCIRNAGHRPEEVLSLLDECGFDIYFILDDRRLYYRLPPGEAGNWADYMRGYEDRYLNLMCVRKDKSLNVCFFSHGVTLMGAERSLLELTRELVKDRGAMVTVVVPKEGPLSRELSRAGAAVILIDFSWWCDWSHVYIDTNTIDERLVNSFLNILAGCRKKLLKINPDVIMTNTIVIPWGAMASVILQKPHAWFIHEFGELDYGFKFFLPFDDVIKIILESSDLIFTTSKAVKEVLFPGADKEHIHPVYTYFDISEDPLESNGKSHYTRPDAVKLIIVGSILESKGQKDAVMAVKELIDRELDAELIILGPAYYNNLEILSDIIEKNGLSAYVKILGWQEKAYSIIKQADIVLVCSRYEAFGRVTAEAMLLQKPVIGTRRGGTAELIIEGYNGLLYEPGNSVELADKIEFFIKNREKIDEMGINGYEYARKIFSRDRFGGEVFRKLKLLKGKSNNMNNKFSRFAVDTMLASIEKLDNRLAGLDRRLIETTDLLNKRESHIDRLENELQDNMNLINNINSGILMRLMTGYNLLINRLFPTGTKINRLYYSGCAALKRILVGGK